MAKQMTLKEGLEAWAAWKTAAHLSPDVLYAFLLHPERHERREEIEAHLQSCLVCRHEREHMLQSIAEAQLCWDVALRQAAASGVGEGVQKIFTEGGKYTIEIRRHVSDKNRGMITVYVASPHREHLEGKTLTLKDHHGKMLLRGKIVDSQVSRAIEGLEQIAYGLIVQTE